MVDPDQAPGRWAKTRPGDVQFGKKSWSWVLFWSACAVPTAIAPVRERRNLPAVLASGSVKVVAPSPTPQVVLILPNRSRPRPAREMVEPSHSNDPDGAVV